MGESVRPTIAGNRDASPIELRCGNCGSTVAPSANARCEHCGETLTARRLTLASPRRPGVGRVVVVWLAAAIVTLPIVAIVLSVGFAAFVQFFGVSADYRTANMALTGPDFENYEIGTGPSNQAGVIRSPVVPFGLTVAPNLSLNPLGYPVGGVGVFFYPKGEMEPDILERMFSGRNEWPYAFGELIARTDWDDGEWKLVRPDGSSQSLSREAVDELLRDACRQYELDYDPALMSWHVAVELVYDFAHLNGERRQYSASELGDHPQLPNQIVSYQHPVSNSIRGDTHPKPTWLHVTLGGLIAAFALWRIGRRLWRDHRAQHDRYDDVVIGYAEQLGITLSDEASRAKA